MEGISSLISEYGPYLEDAKRRIVFTVLFFAAIFVVGFFIAPLLLNQIIMFLRFPGVTYVATSPFQVLGVSVDMGICIAVVATLPLLVVEICAFVYPALLPRERRNIPRLMLTSALLFITGFAYGILVMYWGYKAVASWNIGLGLANLWDIDVFFSQLLLTSALLGLLFQFPLLVLLAARLGFVSRADLKGSRRYVIAGVFIIVALLPPTDGLSLIVMAVPLIAMYEITLLFARETGNRTSAGGAALLPAT